MTYLNSINDDSIYPEENESNTELIDEQLDCFIREDINARVLEGMYILGGHGQFDEEEINVEFPEEYEGQPPRTMTGCTTAKVCGADCSECKRRVCRPPASVDWIAELIEDTPDCLTYKVEQVQ